MEQNVTIATNSLVLKSTVMIPSKVRGIILFAHGSGSSRLSPRNRFVAHILNDASFATVLFDLLTEREDAVYENRFNINLLTERLREATVWCNKQSWCKKLGVGYFGASTGAAAALQASVHSPVKAIVSRGGRPDLAEHLEMVTAPTLLIVGGDDREVIELNRQAYVQLKCSKKLEIVPGATHLFEEAGTLEKVADLARKWFVKHL